METLGITNGQLLAPGVLPSFASAGQWVFPIAIRPLDPPTTPLLKMAPAAGGTNAWMKAEGKGFVMAYLGPGEAPHAETDWANTPPLPLYFLKDALTYLARTGRLQRVPASLWFGKEQVFLVEGANGEILAFNTEDKEVEVRIGERSALVPPRSIHRIP
jgi:hypothetical protein